MKSPYVVSSEGANPYSPANHTGTVNQRVIGRENVGARRVEVLIGTIEKNHGALRHLHPNLEQASYLLQGHGTGELWGVEQLAKPGVWMLTPQAAPHRFTVTSDEPVKVLVVYAPPYAENPNAAVNCEDAPALTTGRPCSPDAAYVQTAFTPDHHHGVQFRYALDLPPGSAKHLAIFDADFEPAGGASSQVLEGMEQVIFLREGELTGNINGLAFSARPGDWIFIPEGAHFDYRAGQDKCVQAFVIHAFASDE